MLCDDEFVAEIRRTPIPRAHMGKFMFRKGKAWTIVSSFEEAVNQIKEVRV